MRLYHHFSTVILATCLLFCSYGWGYTQNTEEFTPLFDGQSLDEWVIENTDEGNFYVKDGAIRAEAPRGWLRSVRQYSDFILKAGFRFLTDDADSGIYVRAAKDTPFVRGWPGNSYQIQTRNITTNKTENPLLLGDIYWHRVPEGQTNFEASAAFEASRDTGEWQEFRIEVSGDSLKVWLNGTVVTRASGITNQEGYIGIQGETGIVEFRSIKIREQ